MTELTKTPKNFLFICTGNSCRSVMAEKLLLKLAADKKLPWQARSCGIATETYFKVPPSVVKVLAASGVTGFDHKAQMVSRDLLGWTDLALAMCEEHVAEVVDRFPEFTRKVHLFRGYLGLPRPNIEDPIGAPEEVYTECLRQIREALEALINKHG